MKIDENAPAHILAGERKLCEECGAANVYWVGLCLFCFVDTHLDMSLVTSLESEVEERVD